MLVSHRYRFIYLKPPKTAGTSVELWLERLCTPAGHVPREASPPLVTAEGIVGAREGLAYTKGHAFWNHMTAAEVRERLEPEVFAAYRKVATVRNPFDLLVSAFHHSVLPQDKAQDMGVDTVVASFREWIAAGGGKEYSMVPFLALDGRPCIDDLIRYETLDHDAWAFVATVGAPGSEMGPLPRKKTHTRLRGIPLVRYYGRKTEARVVADAAADFELLGYSKRVIDAVAQGTEDAGAAGPYPAGRSNAHSDRDSVSGNISKEHEMSDDLIYAVFKELAVVEGKRKPDGTWADANAADVQRILARAFAMVQRASSPAVPGKEDKA